jgi:dienelactone hydrolase
VTSLVAAGDPDHSYALYIPSTSDPKGLAPILYILDPRGRAVVALDRFRAAAEATGVVLASSYDSRSDVIGPDPNLPALRAVWNDTHARLRIDERRVYVAGFSGTARAACVLADAARGTIAGVIAAGAGFAPGHPPRRDTSFAFFGATGDADFNFVEAQELERALFDLGLSYRIESFPGPHDWMPEEVATAALRWMELRAVAGGRREPSPDLLATAWARDEKRAADLEAEQRSFEARRQWTWMVRDYDGLRDVAPARARAEALAPAAQADDRERRRRESRERQWTEDAQRVLAQAKARGDEPWPVGRIVSELQIERRRAQASADTEDARVARRALNSLFVQTAFYLPREAEARGDHAQAVLFLSVATTIRPEEPQAWYRLAAAESRSGRTRQAVEALRHALEAGFDDGARIAADSDFDRVRADAGFRGLLARLGR